MLRQRVITALIMAGSLIAALAFLPVVWLAGLLAVLIALGAWEWALLAGWKHPLARGLYSLLAVLACAGLYVYSGLQVEPSRELVQPVLGVACLWWAFALLWVKGYPGSAVLWRNRVMRSLMGVLILAPAWLAAVYLISLPKGGALLVVMVMVVASADIGAYFSGRALGKHKLALAVSPGKTWEGFWGGIACCALLALALWYMLPDAASHMSLLAVMGIALSTALASVVGDLTVSMVKRESGVKDSGTLLPGHGGLLDRLDSLCGAAPVFALGLLLAGN
ncbi:MAG: phosphatidate cytidylyltransferase [Halioglobus sp.]